MLRNVDFTTFNKLGIITNNLEYVAVPNCFILPTELTFKALKSPNPSDFTDHLH